MKQIRKDLGMQCDLRTLSGVWSCWHKEHSKQDQEVDLSVKSVAYQMREVVITWIVFKAKQ